MDIISYGIANKAGSSEKKTRTQVLGTGVQGRNLTVKDRLDSFDLSLEGLTRKANQLIINDAVNIMKSHARLNAIAKSTRYKMENMIFDDLLTLEGIDQVNSRGFIHNEQLGEIVSTDAKCTINTLPFEVDSIPNKVVLQAQLTDVKQEGALKNIASQATYEAIGSFQGFNPEGLYDGDTNSYKWDDKSIDEKQGFKIKFSKPRQIHSIKLIGHYYYKMYGAEIIADGNRVSITDKLISNTEPYTALIGAAVSEIQVLRIMGTHSHDQTLTEVEVYENDLIEVETTLEDAFQISRDSGMSWQSIKVNSLTQLDSKVAEQGKSFVLKIKLPMDIKIKNYALAWS